MKKLISFLITVASTSACAHWTHVDTALEFGFAAEQIVDYTQTSEAVTYGAEANPVIGAWGQNISPQAFFLTTTLIHVAIASALPRYWREVFQSATLLRQGWNIYGNVGALRANRGCAASVGTSNQCDFGGSK